MLDLIRPRSLCPKCDGSSRREFLRIGTLGMFGLTLADMLRLQSVSAASTNSKPKSVILLSSTAAIRSTKRSILSRMLLPTIAACSGPFQRA